MSLITITKTIIIMITLRAYVDSMGTILDGTIMILGTLTCIITTTTPIIGEQVFTRDLYLVMADMD